MDQPTLLQLRLLHPRYWLTWLGLGLMYLVVHLPLSWRIWFGAALGQLGYRLARRRRHIVEVNLDLCFPAMGDSERDQLCRLVFRSSGIGLVETASVWLRGAAEFDDLVTIHGLEHLKQALDQGNGVILLGMHLSTLDFCGAVLSSHIGFDVMYRKNKNLLLELIMTRGRLRNFPEAIERDNIRGVVASLRKGHILWYGPDQDYGRRHSVFVPFFGQQAATITATARLAAASHSPVILFSHYRRPDDTHYDIHLSEPLTGFPTGDENQDATTINRIIETAITHQPDQYWWLHRRFKTRPAGEQRPY